jgi:hypothetical protein
MKKIKFAAQIFILAAAFPVLFVSGITHHTKKVSQHDLQVIDSSSTGKTSHTVKCLCKAEPPAKQANHSINKQN